MEPTGAYVQICYDAWTHLAVFVLFSNTLTNCNNTWSDFTIIHTKAVYNVVILIHNAYVLWRRHVMHHKQYSWCLYCIISTVRMTSPGPSDFKGCWPHLQRQDDGSSLSGCASFARPWSRTERSLSIPWAAARFSVLFPVFVSVK